MPTKRYWLRGGMLGILLVALCFILPFVENFVTHNSILYLLLSYLLYGNPLFYVLEYACTAANSCLFLLSSAGILVINGAGYFITGAFLGWLYGKIKNRNRVV